MAPAATDSSTSIASSSLTTSNEDPPVRNDWGKRVEFDPPAFEVTSNIRQGRTTPNLPAMEEQDIFSHQHTPIVLADDREFSLPTPDLAPRFILKTDVSWTDDRSSLINNDDLSDTAPLILTPISAPSSPPPRIYFGPSPITFIAPASSDYLERDPTIKGVPRNYRAWSRSGRPRVDVEGADMSEAQSDFRAIGLVYPQDSGSEDMICEDGEADRVRKRRRKKQMVKTAVGIDRPRRITKKVAESVPSATPPLHIKPVNENEGEARLDSGAAAVHGKEKGPPSKSTDFSDNSGQRSSSTLAPMQEYLEMDRREHIIPDEVPTETAVVKRPHVSKRKFSKMDSPQDADVSSPSVSNEDEQDEPPSRGRASYPATSAVARRRSPVQSSERRRSASPAPHSTLRKRTTTQPTKPALTTLSRSALLPASRPGHRISRNVSLGSSQAIPNRTFPASLPVIPGYAGFYRRYPFITQFHPDDPAGRCVVQNDNLSKRALGNWNPPRDHLDLYTPRYTKGSGGKKIALCPICFEDISRGGEGRQEWNHTKTSQHNYHMQYYHGISATRCAPFSPPTSQRISPVPRPHTNEKSQILQGKCHACKQWVALEGCKLGELKVKELLWWKHAAQCHKDSQLTGEGDFFIEDDAYSRYKEYEAAHPEQV